MSKLVKQMQMDALKATFGNVRDLVVLSVKGLSAIGETQFRAAMRKKHIRLQVVKNSFTRRVFGDTVAGNHDRAATGQMDVDEFNPIAARAATWTSTVITKADRAWLDAVYDSPIKISITMKKK